MKYLVLAAALIVGLTAAADSADYDTAMNAGREAFARGRYAEAEGMFQAAIAEAERYGPEDWRVAASLTHLALVYRTQGNYAEAEPLFERALTIREKGVGPDHPLVAASLDSLAGVYHALGKHAEAEAAFKHALAISEKTLGPQHPNVASCLYGLGQLYLAQGKLAEAEPLFERALTIWEQALGPQHPNVAWALTGLAQLYRAQGDDSEAEADELEARAEAIRAARTEGTSQPALGAALVSVACSGDLAGVKSLLASAADDEARGESALAEALACAARKGNQDVVALLLETGVHLAGAGKVGEAALYSAAHAGHAAVVRLLIESKVDVNASTGPPQLWTPLLIAAAEGHSETVRLLVENGADPGVRDSRGRTALEWAAAEGHSDVVAILRAYLPGREPS